jgi:hypothetical protein
MSIAHCRFVKMLYYGSVDPRHTFNPGEIDMNRKLVLSVLIALLTLGLVVMPTMAMKPLKVHIEVPEVIATGPDPFVASGPAVDAGELCAGGTVVDTLSTLGPTLGVVQILYVSKTFTCGDGSGTFDVDMVVKLNTITSKTNAKWQIVGGDGAYTGLIGNGKLKGIPFLPGGVGTILDIYDGRLY